MSIGTLKVSVINLQQVMAAVAALPVKVQKVAQEAANREAQYELLITRRRVPIEHGQLQASGRVEMVRNDDNEATAGIAYGGPAGAGDNTEDVDYALIVHEDLQAKHWFGRSAKYVENVVRDEAESGRAGQRMGAYVSSRL